MESGSHSGAIELASVFIEDGPRYSYRGMMLDVGRHFFDVDFVKKYIDLLAMHKLNTFHWHLTEDQGWRIEIKKYPKLTEVGAFRDETLVGHYRDMPHQFDGERYGGYYTQEEIKEVVEYANSRFVTIVPEIELPGHAMAALAAYPELSCSDEPIKVAQIWGVHEEIFCPTEETFTFLENVLTEVIELFPGKYIHIGGDEAPKTRWEESAFCQQLMKKEGIKDEAGLQSYFIRRIEQFVNSKGRSIIGWDEILEGGLAPNATVMSWRGMEGGIEAAKEGHDVIITPTSHVYFDYYQADPENEPLAIGGNLPIEKVYSLEPTPEELTAEEEKYVIGTQGNLWTEYIKTPEKVEYMVFPRASALAEVAWTSKDNKSWPDFAERLEQHIGRLGSAGVNTAKHIFNVQMLSKPDPETNQLKVELQTISKKGQIVYTTDGSEPNPSSPAYTGEILLEEAATIKAASAYNGELLGMASSKSFTVHKGIGKKVEFSAPPSDKYNAGPFVIGDGVKGGDLFNDLYYGFDGEDLEATIDLGESQPIEMVNIGSLHTTYAWIFYPSEVKVLLSEDGEQFVEAGSISDSSGQEEATPVKRKEYQIDCGGKSARYVKVFAKNTIIPSWHGGAGKGSWLFVDEIEIK